MIRKNKTFTERLKDAKRKNLLTLLDLLDIIMNNKAVINGNSNQALEVMKMVHSIYENDKEWKKKFKGKKITF